VQLEDESALVYCPHCGAPQVRLSEEMLEQAAQQAAAAAAASLDPDAPPGSRPPVERVTDPSAVVWPGAIQCAALAGAVAAVLVLLAFPLPPVSLLSLFWSLAAPIVVLSVYSARFPRTRIHAAFGARLGLLSGLSIAIATMVLITVGLVLARFAFHDAAAIDAWVNQAFAPTRAMLTQYEQQAGAAAVQPMRDVLNIPEFRVGFMLASISMMLAFYLGFCSLAGALGGFLRARAQPRS
jgi:uncharacterized membrane protein (DUF485 family)